ncbi:MAG: HAD-IA family hydrolase [Candidatus Hydrogenedentes bacterium]|nr:HAD-IA family hydrolase [Candidatus Hydrogenedentota bacterium]
MSSKAGKIKGVIFDIGGVLARDVWEHMLCDPIGKKNQWSVSAKYGIPIPELKEFGERLWYDYDTKDGHADKLEKEYWTRIKTRFSQLDHVSISELRAMTDDFIQPVNQTEMAELLKWLGKRVAIGICSNNTCFWYPLQKRKFDPELAFGKEADQQIVLSYREGMNKGDKRMFKKAVQRLGLKEAECVFVDDRFSNVSCAVELGMTGILFPTDEESGVQYLRQLLVRMIA